LANLTLAIVAINGANRLNNRIPHGPGVLSGCRGARGRVARGFTRPWTTCKSAA
jgi:hypothetical protein